MGAYGDLIHVIAFNIVAGNDDVDAIFQAKANQMLFIILSTSKFAITYCHWQQRADCQCEMNQKKYTM